jgi:PAS domain S-box-containing protein
MVRKHGNLLWLGGGARVSGLTGELVVVSGRHRGHRIPISQDILRIGRDRTCEVPLDDEAASRVHSEIVRRGGQFLLRDLRSTNGTYLNDAKVSESPLQNGDRIGVGDTILLLQLEHKAEANTPQVVFSKDQNKVSARLSLSLNDTRFLELKEGTSIPDAQRQFTLLYEFMLDIAGILHPPALLQRSLSHFFRAFTPDRGLILLLTPEGEPGVRATKIRDGLAGHEQITISRTMAHQLLQKKESFLSVNATSDERLAGSESLHSMHVYSIMGAPLQVKDKVIGMVYLDTIGGGKSFSEQDLKLCTAMSVQLAVCLENTRLYTELLDAAEFNNSVLRSLGSGIVVVDATGRVLRINRATQEILGKTETLILGKSLDEFPELSDLSRIIHNTLTTGRPEDRYELVIRTPTQPVPLGLTTSVLSDHAGKIIGVVANFRNLAPIRKLEEQVRRSHHLAALGQMAAGVAHEIRNPLNSIRGFAQLLQEAATSNPTQTEYTQIILEEVDRMNRIVQDLLDFSRQRDLTLLPVQMNRVLEDLVRDMQGEAQKAKVKLEIGPSEEVLPGVLGNTDKLRQVFRNIILNGIQACKADGRVHISFAVVESQVPDQSNPKSRDPSTFVTRREVAVTVEDTGIGIDPAVIQKVFDPFFTQKDSGTGLGLSISQKIAEQHGGRIEVKSELGRGTVFTVYLPAI